MIFNYIKVSIRNLLAQKGYLFINITGLAIGIASALLIILYVVDEFSYDKFHKNSKNTYRVYLNAKIQGQELIGAVTCSPVSPTMVTSYPDVTNFCRVFTFAGEPIIRYENKSFVEKRVFFVDSTFFSVFDGFKLIRGDNTKILNSKNQMVITESTAKRYFGNDDPIGKVVQFGQQKQNWVVTGVMQNPPKNSHLKFDILCSFVSQPQLQNTYWVSNNVYSYIVVKEGVPIKDIDQKLAELTKTRAGPQFEQFAQITPEDFKKSGMRYGYFAQPLLNIHLKSNLQYEPEPGGNLVMVYVFLLVALFIIVIAAINFMNLATARSAKRAREVGVRKVFGSSKTKLISQFLTESIVLSIIALLVALILVFLALPSFNNIAGKQLDLAMLPMAFTIGSLLGTILLIGVAAGSYPAFFLASFEPIKVLKGKLATGSKNSTLRGVLVVLQFTITIGLIVATLIVNKQITFMKSKDLGFDPKNLIYINRGYAIPQDRRTTFIEELQKIPNVEVVSAATSLPGTVFPGTALLPKGASTNQTSLTNFLNSDYDFDKSMGLKIIQGRYFSRDFASDSNAVVINEAVVKSLGLKEPIIGTSLMINASQEINVIGVVKDFHYESLHKQIGPLCLLYGAVSTYITLKIGPLETQKTIKAIEAKWKEFLPDQTFDYSFMEEHLDNQYGSERRSRVIFTVFSLLAIIIASLGLLGLSSFSAEQRTKEIGVRKVNGASVFTIIRLLFKEINLLFLISTAIAWPIAWYSMSSWLENFAYRIKLSPVEFLLASFIAYLIAALTVSYQAIKAARTNPATTLKYE